MNRIPAKDNNLHMMMVSSPFLTFKDAMCFLVASLIEAFLHSSYFLTMGLPFVMVKQKSYFFFTS